MLISGLYEEIGELLEQIVELMTMLEEEKTVELYGLG